MKKQEAGITASADKVIAQRLSTHIDGAYAACEKLKSDLEAVPAGDQEAANYFHSVITADMAALRKDADALEALTDKTYWPYPTYSDILFY